MVSKHILSVEPFRVASSTSQGVSYNYMIMTFQMTYTYLIAMHVVILTSKFMTYPNVMEADEVEILGLLQNHYTEKNPKSRKAAQGKLKLKRSITVDSGAGSSVMPRRMVMNKSEIRESEGFQNGVQYVAANDGRIQNEGSTISNLRQSKAMNKT